MIVIYIYMYINTIYIVTYIYMIIHVLNPFNPVTWTSTQVPFYMHENMKKNPQTGPILPRRVDHRAPAIAATNSARGRSMGAQCP